MTRSEECVRRVWDETKEREIKGKIEADHGVGSCTSGSWKKWTEVGGSGQKWAEVGRSGQKWTEVDRSGQKWTEMDRSGQKRSEVVRNENRKYWT